MNAHQQAFIEWFINLLSIIGAVAWSIAWPQGSIAWYAAINGIFRYIVSVFFTVLWAVVWTEIAIQLLEEMSKQKYQNSDPVHESVEDFFANPGLKLWTQIIYTWWEKVAMSMLSIDAPVNDMIKNNKLTNQNSYL